MSDVDRIVVMAQDPVTGEPMCPYCEAVGDQPHAEGCESGRGWQHAIRPPDQLW